MLQKERVKYSKPLIINKISASPQCVVLKKVYQKKVNYYGSKDHAGTASPEENKDE